MNLHFEEIKGHVRAQISTAKTNIIIALAWLSDEDIIFDLSNKSKNEGVKIRILISDDAANFKKYSRLNELVKAGIDLRIMKGSSKFLHHKICLIDNKKFITGSYNWTYTASKYNIENIIIIDVSDSNEMIEKINNEFNKIF